MVLYKVKKGTKNILKFYGYIHEEKKSNLSDPSIVIKEFPDYFYDEDLIYLDENKEMHFVDLRPIFELNQNIADLISKNESRILTRENQSKYFYYSLAKQEYMENPHLLSGEEEKKYIAWKKKNKVDQQFYFV